MSLQQGFKLNIDWMITSMFHTFRAKYLQLMSIYYIYKNDKERVSKVCLKML